jgi:hypothetical protein
MATIAGEHAGSSWENGKGEPMTTTTTLQGPYVFLSYPRFEEAFTKQLEEDLRAHNLQVWRDESNIKPGTPDWEATIRDAISQAYAVVLIASPSVLNSLYIKGELNLAKRYHPQRIYPIWMGGTEWSDCVPIDFIHTQYIDMREEKYAAGLNELTKALHKAKEQPVHVPQESALQPQGALPPYPPYAQVQGSRQEGLSSAVPPLPVSQGKKPPRRFPVGITLLLSLLLVLLVGGSGLYYTAVYQPNRLHVLPSAPPVAPLHATAAAEENPYTHSGRLALSDPLQNNSSGYLWAEDSTCRFMDGAYHVKVPTYPDTCLASNTPDFSNFAFEVQMRILKGDAGGLLFRVVELAATASKYYDFVISPDGQYWLVRANDPSETPYLELKSGRSSFIKQGINQTNLIAVVVQGNTITLYVNHQKIALPLADSTFSHGRVALEAGLSNPGNPTEVVFSNVKIWTL